MRILHKLLLIWICLAHSLIFAGTIQSINYDELHLNFAKDLKFNSVLLLICKNNNDIIFTSSCVAIKSNIVVTAAHLISRLDKEDRLYVVCDGVNNPIRKIVSHPNFRHTKMGFYDIAICYTENPINIDEFPELYKKKDELNKQVLLCGFGMSGNFATGATINDLKKRAGANTIDSIKNHSLVCSVNTSPYSDLEFLTAHGDSGGGLFIDEKLAGIHSYIYASDKHPDASITDKSGHTRISIFVDWIEANSKRIQK